ncbi:MAG: CRISPR system precrRNA processing endoribonuclease RAMP protein Cas6 [Candidatus Binatia bacterium]
MGRVEWKGKALAPLWPLLSFGELVQIGKGTALGFGRYRIVAPGYAAVDSNALSGSASPAATDHTRGPEPRLACQKARTSTTERFTR